MLSCDGWSNGRALDMKEEKVDLPAKPESGLAC